LAFPRLFSTGEIIQYNYLDGDDEMALSRRNFLKIGALAGLSVTAVVSGLFVLSNEAEDPVIDEVVVPIQNLKPGLEGFRIVQLSDIHLRPYTKPDLVERAVELANQLKPDLTVLTGDFVWRDRDAAFELAPILAGLNARYGVFSVMGNHDYWLDIQALQQAFDDAGLPVLYNQGHVIQHNGANLYLAGMDDGWSGQPDLQAALADSPANTPVVLLLHEPDLIDQVSADPRVTLQLAGHTHGGQVVVPGQPPFFTPYLGKKYSQGLFKVQLAWLYTNRGLGTISVPYRLNCPPEVTLLTLAAA
jgi:predicted MPP superfamily phosphohydrolase